MISLTMLQLKYLENKVTANSKNTNHRMVKTLMDKSKKVSIYGLYRGCIHNLREWSRYLYIKSKS